VAREIGTPLVQREPLPLEPVRVIGVPVGARAPPRRGPWRKLLRTAELLVGIEASPSSTHAPSSGTNKKASLSKILCLSDSNSAPRRSFCAHPIIAGLVSLDPVGLRQEHPVVGTLE
jgi:hypothetical protein